jgi:RHS repeat-associated protein
MYFYKRMNRTSNINTKLNISRLNSQDYSFASTIPSAHYQYDVLYRLIQAAGRELTSLAMPTPDDFVNNLPCPSTDPNALQNYTQKYKYDELGNIMQMKGVGNWTRDYVYQVGKNYLLKHDEEQSLPDYTYDAHGNTLSMPHLSSMEWDEKDQLHSATNGTFTSYYNYDAQGNRTRKVVDKAGGITETRYYIGGYEVFRKENSTADFERTTLNITDDEKTFVRIETKTGESPVIRYQYDNHLGSACLELDIDGEIISYEEYHPFGTTSYRSGRSEIEVSLKRYKYCGKERDEETGLYYYGMRYYAAWLCRFVSVDPLQFKYPHYTPYQYAGNKPVSFIDLDGGEEKKPEKPTGKVINAHAQAKQNAEVKVAETQAEIERLQENKPEKSNKEASAAYKDQLNSLQEELRKGKATLRDARGKYYEVENLLDDYAFYDPKGYEQLSQYTDIDGNPIDIYVRIDETLEFKGSTTEIAYGKAGNLFYNVSNPLVSNRQGINTEYGDNTIIINLAHNTPSSTIAHEKGHLDFDFYNEAEDISYRKNNPTLNLNRHDEGDPSGIASDKATTKYINERTRMENSGKYFNYRTDKRKK